MAEILFILTTIFVAYVVYVMVGEQMADMKAIASKKAGHSVEVHATAKTEDKKAANKPAPRAQAGKPVGPVAVSEPVSAGGRASSLRDPATGETASVPTNYRFAKRWIKETMVKEGLLDKVYKNSELDDAANAKIKTALDHLVQMDKYRG